MHILVQEALLTPLILHRECEEISAYDFAKVGTVLIHQIANSPKQHRLLNRLIHMMDRDMLPDSENPTNETPRSDDRHKTFKTPQSDHRKITFGLRKDGQLPRPENKDHIIWCNSCRGRIFVSARHLQWLRDNHQIYSNRIEHILPVGIYKEGGETDDPPDQEMKVEFIDVSYSCPVCSRKKFGD